MNIAVVYCSKYGAAKQYAEWIAQALDTKPFPIEGFQGEGCDAVVFGGGLYAGDINGIKRALKLPVKLCAVYTVGIADPETADYKQVLNKNFAPGQLKGVRMFHLHGGMDYAQLGFIHKSMMDVMKRRLMKKPENERTPEEKGILATYGRAVNYMDKASIAPLVAYVKSLQDG